MSAKDINVEILQQMRNTMLESSDWETMKPYIDAITAGGMALQAISDRNSLINIMVHTIKSMPGKDDYSVGMRNGIRYSMSLMNEKEPEYESCVIKKDNISRAQVIKSIKALFKSGNTDEKSIIDMINSFDEL